MERIFVIFDDLTSLVHLLVTGQVQSRSATRSTGA